MTTDARDGPTVTDRVTRVFELAGEEASRRHRSAAGSDEVLLAIVREGGGVACAVLHQLGVSPTALEAEVRARLETEPPAPSTSVTALVRIAAGDAVALGHSYVGTEHLLIAIARQRGAAGTALASHGVTDATAAAMTGRLLGRERC